MTRQGVVLAVSLGADAKLHAFALNRVRQLLGGQRPLFRVEAAIGPVADVNSPRPDHKPAAPPGCDAGATAARGEPVAGRRRAGRSRARPSSGRRCDRRRADWPFLPVDFAGGEDRRRRRICTPAAGRPCSSRRRTTISSLSSAFLTPRWPPGGVRREQGERAAQRARRGRAPGRPRAAGSAAAPARARRPRASRPRGARGRRGCRAGRCPGSLVLIAGADARRVEQRQAHGVVVGLVRAELAVVEDRRRRTCRPCPSGRTTGAGAPRTFSGCCCRADVPTCRHRSPCGLPVVSGNDALRLASRVCQSILLANSTRSPAPPAPGGCVCTNASRRLALTSRATRTGPFSTTRTLAGPHVPARRLLRVLPVHVPRRELRSGSRTGTPAAAAPRALRASRACRKPRRCRRRRSSVTRKRAFSRSILAHAQAAMLRATRRRRRRPGWQSIDRETRRDGTLAGNKT